MNRWYLSFLILALLLGLFSSLASAPASLAAEEPLVLHRPSPADFDPQAGEQLRITYYLAEDARTFTIQVKNFTGAVIRQEVVSDVKAGPGAWQWDGRDDRRQLVTEGQYQIFVIGDFSDDRRVTDFVLVTIVARAAKAPAPPPMPVPIRPFRISGEISGYYRRNIDEQEETYEGRVGVHAVYDKKPVAADVNFYLIQRDREETNFDNCYASFTYDRKELTFLSVFRKSLGAFTDPFRLFDDVRTEYFKSGARLDVHPGFLTVTGLGFAAEGDTFSEEKGYATRVTVPLPGRITLGSSFVSRYYKTAEFANEVRNLAGEVDGVIVLGRGFSLAAEYAVSDDEETDESDMAGRVELRYERPRLKGIVGYQDLGEHFKADLAYMSQQVTSDARGIDGVLDYFPGRVWFMERAGILVRSFYYQRKSTFENLYEVDANARFGIGPKDDFMLGFIDHKDEVSDYTSARARHLHRFTERWSNEASYAVNISAGNTTHTVRELVHYSRPLRRNITGGVQWINGRAEGRDPSRWNELDLLIYGEWGGWFFEAEERFLFDERIGANFFVKVGYRIEFLKRYQAECYVAYGDRASRETSNTVEVGMGVYF